MPIRILIADDHAVVRSGLRALLLADPDLEVVGEAGDGTETLRLAESLEPDVVLLDITMPPEDGIKTAQRLKEKNPELCVLFLTMHEDEAMMHEALRAGASGYVIKRAEESEIIQAIHAAFRGDIYVHPAMTRALLQQPVTTQHRRGSQPEQLTRRELEVLRLLVRGNTNRQIAELLGLSVRTVENHRANLMGKLGLVSRVELVDYAEENDLL
ncbi:MAG TPA: response regulator transcription factor [Candidatus Sulfomarinibacteraceae bacterium]|nr:response regulator transcription factor [Candidatus Sulfomarinibacteraceae bacterium]